jgi:nucleotide-binding universal stress UspA family protein
MAPDVHQCPYCELRFAYRPELADHVAADHPRPVDEDLPAVPAATGHVTVPLDPAHPPTAALAVAAAVAAQAGFAVEVVAAPAVGLPTAPYLAALRRQVLAAGATAAPTVELAGPAADAIVAHAAGGATRYLCMATHAWGPVGERALGSVSAHVVRHSPVPVLLTGPALARPGQPVRRVLAGIDGSVLSRRALDVAADLAGRLDVPLDLAYVVRPDDPYADMPDAAVLWAARHLQPPWDYDVVHGDDPARALAERAGHAGDTITVVGTHGRTGLALAVLGSVALGLARHASGPVLVLPATAAREPGEAATADDTAAVRSGGGA